MRRFCCRWGPKRCGGLCMCGSGRGAPLFPLLLLLLVLLVVQVLVWGAGCGWLWW